MTTTPHVSARPMQVRRIRVYRGPHLHSMTPMVQVELDLGWLEQWPTDRLGEFSARLVALLPGLADHGCSDGVPGGFLRRLEEGTWLGHVIEHVALELQARAGHRITRGKTRSVKDQPGVYHVMYAYQDREIGLLAGRLAIELVESLLPLEFGGVLGLGGFGVEVPGHLAEGLERLQDLARERALGPTTAALVQEAERRGIPVARLDGDSLMRLGQGRHQKRIRASCTDLTSQVATDIAGDKDLTKALLSEAGLPVPRGATVRSRDDAVEAARRLGFPVVAKPLDGNHGRGVNTGLASDHDVRWAFDQAAPEGAAVIVEQMMPGDDHRILVVGGRVVAAARRLPPIAIGDGASTIREIVAEMNRDPRRGVGHEAVLTRIEIDDCMEHFLASQGLGPDSVLRPGQEVRLRPTANLSTGGTATDVTDIMHPGTRLAAERAARIVGLDIAGIDLVCPDITRPLSETGGGIVEVNAGPGFRMHVAPSAGRPRDVAGPVMDLLFPEGSQGRIPIFAVTGTNGKSTTGRMLAHVLRASGQRVGLTSTTGILIDGREVETGDCAGPGSARLVLAEPGVDAAVLECARGGILREGLGFQDCDVGCVLNVRPDHLGQGGVATLEDMAAVKSVVVEAVRRDGWSVLNADDPLVAGMADDAGGRICWFSLRPEAEWHDSLREGLARQDRAVSQENETIILHQDGRRLALMSVRDIPATFGGAALFNIENALAAIAMAWCGGVEPATLRDAMSSFATSYETTPGRLNLHRNGVFDTILDYAHCAGSLEALGTFVRRLDPAPRRVIALVGAPGDRRDEDIRTMGAVAGRHFDIVVFKEDQDLRGRAPGEAAALLMEGALGAGCPRSRLFTVRDEVEATRHALRLGGPGDLVVVTADDIAAVWDQIRSFSPRTREVPALARAG
ncbi:cyanophycin synthetase [Rubellimicrobium arenae]|uniref:cyanophycin synthetase n=1 Tax=Rubellimicrobium arenae TaxID=2817372 RepID=UPI001B3067AC|nr:cyanophycin synthetase [Rubellimicrobium arenae]